MGFSFLFAGFAGLVVYGVAMAFLEAVIDPTGQWFGPWPLEGAKDCRTKLFPDGRFEMECRERETYVGLGRWSREVNHVTFEFSALSREGRQVGNTPTMTLRIDGTQNTLALGELRDAGEPYTWRRARL
jgi:hypothetical protein